MHVLGAGFRFGLVAFGHQHIAIGQHIHPARMVQARGQRRDLEAFGRLRHLPLGPAQCGRDIHRGQQTALVGRRQLRVHTQAGGWQLLGRSAGHAAGQGQQRQPVQGLGRGWLVHAPSMVGRFCAPL
ncbi:hypothetical protein D3C71_1588970 [compost metagenome]